MVAGATAPDEVTVNVTDPESPLEPVAVMVAGPGGAFDGISTTEEKSPFESDVPDPIVVGSLIVTVIDSPGTNPVQVRVVVVPAGPVEVLSVHVTPKAVTVTGGGVEGGGVEGGGGVRAKGVTGGGVGLGAGG
jgi:hypothetical protein